MDMPVFNFGFEAYRERRGRLTGEISSLRARLLACERELENVTAVLHIIDPESDPNDIPLRRFYLKTQMFRQGQLGYWLVTILRDANAPLSTLEIVEGIAAKGVLDSRGKRALYVRMRSNLIHLAKHRRVKKLGNGRGARWIIDPAFGRRTQPP
jgi:hypothetical protein